MSVVTPDYKPVQDRIHKVKRWFPEEENTLAIKIYFYHMLSKNRNIKAKNQIKGNL